MHPGSRARRGSVALLATLLLLTAWVAAGHRPFLAATVQQHSAPVGAPERSVSDTLGAVGVEHAVIAPVPAGARIADLGAGPVWTLAALAAALAALAVFRRRPLGSGIGIRPVLLRSSVARRAPPLASFA